MLFAGVDGGQSGSRVALADESGAIVARVHGPPLFVRDDANSASIVAELAQLLRRARAEGGRAEDEPLRAVVAGLSGQDSPADILPAALGAATARLVHDAEIAHAGALAGYHGIVVIAGSGSVAFGTDAVGRRVRRGGWGHTFGDEGGAFWIGRRAISAAMIAEDEGTPTRLGSEARALFGVPTLRALQHAARRGAIAAPELASFAPTVLTLAQEDDEMAAGVFREATRALCDLVVSVDRALEPGTGRAVSFGGRVFSDRALRGAWRSAVESTLAAPRIFPPRAEPVVGALVLAFRDAGLEPPPALLQTVAE